LSNVTGPETLGKPAGGNRVKEHGTKHKRTVPKGFSSLHSCGGGDGGGKYPGI